jgi:hypothetical protein
MKCNAIKIRWSIYKVKYKVPLKPCHRDVKHQVPPAKKQNESHQGVW